MEPQRPTNRLANERSPYLLQHRHNPVDWHPWGDEAFELSRTTDRPVFLSIGYSACHWCHVMERESFEDERIAVVMNRDFVCIKVDREERPDVDQVYQLAHQVLTQRGGGWPLSMFLTPDRRPFFGGTYFPDARRHGMPSFGEVLEAMSAAWRDQREEIVGQAGEVTELVAKFTVSTAKASAEGPSREFLAESVRSALARRDGTWGGFGRAPKFPNTMSLDLLAMAAVTLDGTLADEARAHFALTLDKMAAGGMHDHLGGGFARYSTDARWLVPHFEKMLYDNAQLARTYLQGDRIDHGRGWSQVVRDTVGYLLREMVSAEGCFYSAQDADSEGEEGKFFVWTPAQVAEVVGREHAPAVCAYFDVTDEGNFEHGNSVLWTPRPMHEVATALGIQDHVLAERIGDARTAMLSVRDGRPHPALDDKCLAAWNGLAITALADAGATLDEPTWVAAATRALTAWQTRAWRDRQLKHAMKHGEAYGTGFLDDYAGLACAAIDVYEATFDSEALAFARGLCDAVLARFIDEPTGELCYTPSDGEVVLVRARDPHDHAYPGGVGLALDALLRVGMLTGDARYGAAAERALVGVLEAVKGNPLGAATVLRAADHVARGTVEIIVVGDPSRAETHALLKAARGVYIPHRVLAVAKDTEDARRQGLDAALFEGRTSGEGGLPRVYVCHGTTCDLPVTEPDALIATLTRVVCAG